jgi:prophage regulatory protein
MSTISKANLPEIGYIRLPTILEVLPISKTRFYGGIKAGEFPAPCHIGRLSLWRAQDIRRLIERIGNGEK